MDDAHSKASTSASHKEADAEETKSESESSSASDYSSSESDDIPVEDVALLHLEFLNDDDNDEEAQETTVLEEDTSTKLQNEISALVSPKECQDSSYDQEVPKSERIYKTPRSRVQPVVEAVVADVETTPRKIRDTPLPLLTWAESEEVWQNLVYKEEATSPLRNVRIFDERAAYLPRMRAILLDWIMEVCEVYHLRRNTYYLAVDYIDRFLTARPAVSKTQLQLLGVSCLFIAAKLEEIYPPKLAEFSYVCDGACTEEEILTCEILLLNILGWEVNAMTPTGWLNLYMQIHHNATDICKLKTLALDARHFEYPQYSAYEFVRASHLLDIFSMDPGFLRFSYSTIAAAAMFYTYGEEVALRVSGLKRKQLRECAHYMRIFNYIIDDTLDPRLVSIVPSQEDDRLSRSFNYVRKHVPKLVPNEDHSIQTHLVDLEYFERSVIVRVEQYGIRVRKAFLRKYKTESGDTDFETLNEEPKEQESPTVTVYELQPPDAYIEDVGSPPADVGVAKPLHPTDADYEAGKVNIFRLAQKTTVTFDDILSSIHHDICIAKVVRASSGYA